MIQDIGPRKLWNQYKALRPEAGDSVLVFTRDEILLHKTGDQPFISYAEYDPENMKKAVYLFSIDETRYFLAMDFAVKEEKLPANCSFRKMFETRSTLTIEQALVAATGWHLYIWYRDNQFCGRCGAKVTENEKERMLECSCGNKIFPKIAPAVIVAVTRGDEILLTRYANRPYSRYALIAGFTEIGETAEETVRREVMEEVGLKVKNIRYYKSQPWGFDSNLLLGFFCEVDGASAIRIDEEELAMGGWIKREEVPDYGEGLSLTHEMMQVFKNAKH